VHHEVDGIAAQAVAVSHALATGSMREGSGMLSASAQDVASSVRQLQAERSLWAPPPGPIAILDPVTGLAVRLAHVRHNGTLTLEEIGTGALAPADAAAPVAELAEAPYGEPAPVIARLPVITPNGALLDLLPGANHVPAPPLELAPSLLLGPVAPKLRDRFILVRGLANLARQGAACKNPVLEAVTVHVLARAGALARNDERLTTSLEADATLTCLHFVRSQLPSTCHKGAFSSCCRRKAGPSFTKVHMKRQKKTRDSSQKRWTYLELTLDLTGLEWL
jgi:hypothetical protein